MHKVMERMVVRTEKMETICKARQAALMDRYYSPHGNMEQDEIDELRQLINRRVCIVR